MSIKLKVILALSICIILFLVGFFIGRGKTITKTIYIKGETVTNTVTVPVPYEVIIPAKPSLPTKTDTLRLPGQPYKVYMTVDTAQIIANYIKENKYSRELFDDNNGKMVLNLSVQYNALDKLSYTFTPMTKVIIQERTIVPYIEASYNSFGYLGLGGGVYYHNVGIGAKYMTNFTSKGIEGSVKYKF